MPVIRNAGQFSFKHKNNAKKKILLTQKNIKKINKKTHSSIK
jgi:hypothetical protein